MRLLDLFCGAGGAGMGYHRAGFEVVGVDIKPQRHYPFEFHQADALEYLAEHGAEFDVIHASPPCQAFTAMRTMPNHKEHISLVEPTRELLIASGKLYIIENVPGAPLVDPITICGSMFHLGLKDGRAELRRHRLFESNIYLGLVSPCEHGWSNGLVCGVYGGHGRDRRRTITVVGDGNGRDYRKNPVTVGVYGSAACRSVRDGTQQFTTEERREAMGIDWMNGDELSQAIPPAYCEWIGKRIMEATK